MENFSLYNIFEDNEIPGNIDQQPSSSFSSHGFFQSDAFSVGLDSEDQRKSEEQKRSSLIAQITRKERLLSINRNMQMLIRQQLELVNGLIVQNTKTESDGMAYDFLSSFPLDYSSTFFSRQRRNYPRLISSEGKLLSIVFIKPVSVKRWTKESDDKLSALVHSQCLQLIKFGSVPSKEAENCKRYNEAKSEEEKDRILHEMMPSLINYFSWEQIAADVGHSCSDCFVHWLNCCDPFINTDEWQIEEDANLSTIVKKRGGRDWRAIACELNTNRTPYQCFERYVRVLELEDYNRRWNREEDKAVLEGVKRYGTKNWVKIASLVRTKHWVQCRSRYFQSLRFQGKKGRWGSFETNKLLLFLFFYSWRDWTWIAQEMVTRNVAQCRDRWTNVLHPDVSNRPWSSEEEALLRRLVGGKSRVVWKEVCKNFSGRTADACKTHFKNCMKSSFVCFILIVPPGLNFSFLCSCMGMGVQFFWLL